MYYEEKNFRYFVWLNVPADLVILIYPTVSNQWNTYRQNQLISSYEELIGKMAEEDFTKEWEKANAFNDTIIHNNIFGDVFGENGDDIKNTEYWQILNVGNDGVMGYVSIPKINVKLSIYHGTADDVLQTGIGHLNGTKLPIGGRAHTAYWQRTGVCRVPDCLRILTS